MRILDGSCSVNLPIFAVFVRAPPPYTHRPTQKCKERGFKGAAWWAVCTWSKRKEKGTKSFPEYTHLVSTNEGLEGGILMRHDRTKVGEPAQSLFSSGWRRRGSPLLNQLQVSLVAGPLLAKLPFVCGVSYFASDIVTRNVSFFPLFFFPFCYRVFIAAIPLGTRKMKAGSNE